MLKIQQKGNVMKDYFPVLEKCPLFAGISMEELSGLLHCLGAVRRDVIKGETVFAEGDAASQMGIVLSGAVRLTREDYYGNRSIVARAGPGELFAESYACAGVEAIPVSVVSEEPSELLLIDCRRLTVSCANACSFHSRIVRNLLQLVAGKNLIFDQKIQITSQRSTREKLMAYLSNQMKLHNSRSFTIPYDRQALADYLEVDRSGLSSQISQLRKEGILESKKNHFRIL